MLAGRRPAEEGDQEEDVEEKEDHEFDLPEVLDEPIAKRARVGTLNSPAQEQEATVGADEEPAQKRAWEVMVTCANGIECAMCGKSFASRNLLFTRLREVLSCSRSGEGSIDPGVYFNWASKY